MGGRSDQASDLLRTEKEAQEFCTSRKFRWGVTRTKSKDHHQATKPLIAAVEGVAHSVCNEFSVTYNSHPTVRCIWRVNDCLHVSTRNLDGAIPDVKDPFVVWEIKEYWGKTKGGSKMSDAVYECHLVGREIRDFEEISGVKIKHFAFIDGKEQWGARKSDLIRLIDLCAQGILDDLFIGKEVENRFEAILRDVMIERRIV